MKMSEANKNDDVLNDTEVKVVLMMLMHGGRVPQELWHDVYQGATGGSVDTKLKPRNLIQDIGVATVLTERGRRALAKWEADHA
jgi:hypothetical protein